MKPGDFVETAFDRGSNCNIWYNPERVFDTERGIVGKLHGRKFMLVIAVCKGHELQTSSCFILSDMRLGWVNVDFLRVVE